METGLLTLLILASFLFALFWLENGRLNHLLLSSAFLGLAFLTRNDSFIFAPLLFGFLLYKKWRLGGSRAEFFLLFYAALSYTIFIVGQIMFRLWYYGEIVPNTYTLKVTGVPLSVSLRWGLAFIAPFLIQSSILLGIATLEIARTRLKSVGLILVLGAALAYQVRVGGDPWHLWRIMVPGMPFVFILCASALIAMEQWLKGWVKLSAAQVALSALPLVLLILNLIAVNVPLSSQIYDSDGQNLQAVYNGHNVNVAIGINALTTKDASIGVVWAGALPFYADRRAVDFLGKSDKHIANLPAHLDIALPGHNKFDLQYSIRTLQPTYIQSFQRNNEENLRDWVVKNYIRTDYITKYGNITLILKRNDPSILWDKGTLIPWLGEPNS
jgi:hypothetical protein